MSKTRTPEIAPSPNDLADAARLAPIIAEVNGLDVPRMDVLLERLVKRQPFIMSMLLGYHAAHNPQVFDAIARCILIVWRFHESSGRDGTPITQDRYEAMMRSNLAMLKYAEGEPGAGGAKAVFANDLATKRGRSVLAALQGILMAQTEMLEQGLPVKGQLLLELSTLNDCFFEVSAVKDRH